MTAWIPRPDLEKTLYVPLMARLQAIAAPVIKTCKYKIDNYQFHLVRIDCGGVTMEDRLDPREMACYRNELHAEKATAEHVAWAILYRMGGRPTEPIEQLADEIRMSGRSFRSDALVKLVAFWRKRTPMTTTEVCDLIRHDMRHRLPLSISKYGFK